MQTLRLMLKDVLLLLQTALVVVVVLLALVVLGQLILLVLTLSKTLVLEPLLKMVISYMLRVMQE